MKKFSFDEYAVKYEQWFDKNHWAYQSELLAVKEQLTDGGKGLEIGVGSGRFAGPLGIKIGVDPSLKMADIARKRGIEVVKAKAENLPFSDGQFDFALMVTTICFVDDIDASFREVSRILKPNGQLIIGFVDKNSLLGKIYQEQKGKSIFYRFAEFHSTDEVVSHLKDAGFKKFEYCQTLFKKLEDIDRIEPVQEGYGKGSFVVIRAVKVRIIRGE